jgi:hypothetical protein
MLAAILILASATPGGNPHGVGQFAGWGAFRHGDRQVCYVAAVPTRGGGSVSVIAPPGAPRIEVRFDRPARPGSAALSIDGRRFTLVGTGPLVATRRAMINALRTRDQMRVTARDAQGRAMTQVYALRGFASALDAATLACLAP